MAMSVLEPEPVLLLAPVPMLVPVLMLVLVPVVVTAGKRFRQGGRVKED
jgi:hypothetical protein